MTDAPFARIRSLRDVDATSGHADRHRETHEHAATYAPIANIWRILRRAAQLGHGHSRNRDFSVQNVRYATQASYPIAPVDDPNL